MSDDLCRALAPISPSAWRCIDEAARRALGVHLAARRLVNLSGPHGWDHSAVNLGRARRISDGVNHGVRALLREVQPLVELRVPFRLDRDELESITRGNPSPDLAPLLEACRNIAAAEDRVVFGGLEEALIRGIYSHSEHEPVLLDPDLGNMPAAAAIALERLRRVGVAGPYAMALGTRAWAGLSALFFGGRSGLDVLRSVVDGPVVHSAVLDGGLLLSQRGGDFELVLGRDIQIGYSAHDSASVDLYLEESFTFRLMGADAVIPLVIAGSR